MKCKKHPRYKGIRKPKYSSKHPLGCSDCWKVYLFSPKPKLYEPDEKALEHLKTLTPEKIRESIEDFKKTNDWQKSDEPRDNRTGTCMICQGKIVARVTREYHGDPMHMIIGPGSRNQMTTVHHGFHCTRCGLKYEFPPPKDLNSVDGSA